jgi:hypothetical protein
MPDDRDHVLWLISHSRTRTGKDKFIIKQQTADSA